MLICSSGWVASVVCQGCLCCCGVATGACLQKPVLTVFCTAIKNGLNAKRAATTLSSKTYLLILTNCAACAAPPARDAPRCVRCKTRYCDSTYQHDHWRRGHKQICKKIHRGGNVERYHADNKYKEAVAEAVEACADDTKSQTCYICTQALHWKTKEGLVRGCACRGTAGFAHVSCLAEQAKILVVEAEENNLDMEPRWDRWQACSLCGQQYYGFVFCALGWACWKTYVGRPEADFLRQTAMNQFGAGLSAARQFANALSIQEAQLSMLRRIGAPKDNILTVQSNLANTYNRCGWTKEATRMQRDVYSGYLKLYGKEYRETLREACNYAASFLGSRSSKKSNH